MKQKSIYILRNLELNENKKQKKVDTAKKVGLAALGLAVVGGIAAFAAYKSASNNKKEKEKCEAKK